MRSNGDQRSAERFHKDMTLIKKLPGVGRKTANVVLNEAFGIVEGIAVDTHVIRIAHKLKLVGPSADNTPQKTEDAPKALSEAVLGTD